MDPLNATIEEFAAEGYPKMPRDADQADELASENLDGSHSRWARPATALR
jgi:hypothetical protein